MNKFYYALIVLTLSAFLNNPSLAQDNQQSTSVDKIVALVNNHIILKSEVDQRVREYMYQLQQENDQSPEFNDNIWYTILQDMVQNKVLLDQAAVDSVIVSDDQVDQAINQRIQQTVQQMGSEKALEERMGKSIIELRADLRDQYREDLTIQRYRQTRMDKIDITRPEVEAFFEDIPTDSVPTIPEEIAISQIVAIPAPKQDAREAARKLAEQLRDSLINHGKTIEELAKKYSDGPSGPNGGKLPMVPLDELVPEYSAAASALKPGDISKVVETSFGFHVIRLNKRQGDKIDTNHILISIKEGSYDDQSAINELNQLRDSVLTHADVDFTELAREVSEDPNTAPQGGRILNPQTGQRLLAIERLDPALYRIVLLLDKEGDISEPKPFNIGTENNSKRAFRIVRLDEHIAEHKGNLKDDYKRIKNFALQQKRYKVIQEWINKLENKNYIEYKVPIPQQFTQVQN